MIRAAIVGGAAIGFLVAVFVMIGGGGDGGDANLVARPITAKVLSPTVQFRQGGGQLADVGTGDKLREGAVIETDVTGMGEFRYGDGSLLRVGPDSDYTLNKARSQGNARDIQGTLVTGKTWHKVTPRDADYAIKVTGATGTVVGTSVSTVCLSEFDCVYTVVRGRLEVEAQSDQKAELEAGDQVAVKFGRLDPVRRLTAEEMASDPWISQNLLLDGEDVSATSIAETTTTVEGETTTTIEGVPGETTVPGARTGTTTGTRPGGGTTPGTSPPGTSGTQPTTATTQPTATTASTAPATTTTRTPQQQAWCDNHKKDPRWAEHCS